MPVLTQAARLIRPGTPVVSVSKGLVAVRGRVVTLSAAIREATGLRVVSVAGPSKAMELARRESIFTGSSGGAAAAGARQVAQRLGADGLVVTLFPDSGERYLSKLNKEWMGEKGLLED